MSTSTLKSSGSTAPRAGWQEFYWAAMLEADSAKFSQRISEARHAILDRAEEIMCASASDERGHLNDALRALRVLEEAVGREKPAA
jgi:hypothetical protein